MQQLISFFSKYKYLLFFIILQLISFSLIINNNNFHKSKFVNSTNFLSGRFYEKTSNISDYFHLKERNTALALENEKLKNTLAKLTNNSNADNSNIYVFDSLKYRQKYKYSKSIITKNEYHKPYNFLLINSGKKDSIYKEMAVINSKGVIGITEKTTKNYTRVQSILNKNSKINARIKNNSNHFGSLIWEGKDYNIVQLIDIPRQANIKIGDTIITGGRSAIFPEGIPIGKVIKTHNGNSTNNKISVKLFNDMSNLRHVYVVKNLDKLEINEVQDE